MVHKDKDSIIFHETPTSKDDSEPKSYRLMVMPEIIGIVDVIRNPNRPHNSIVIAIEDWEEIKKYVDTQLKFSNR
jgi:hypothetical protein